MIDEKILRKAQTPAYIFSEDELMDRVRLMQNRLGEGIRLVYAVKANPFLIESLCPVIDGFEACSPGEDRICRALGVPSEKMVISGVNKKAADIDEQVAHHGTKAVYTAESPLQMRLLNAAAKKAGVVINVLLRLSSGNQFGMDAENIRALIRDRDLYENVRLRGLQYFSGTQKKLKRIAAEIDETDGLLTEMAELFEYGPGLPVSYYPSDRAVTDEELLGTLKSSLDVMNFKGQITLEIGRFLAAHCGYYLTKAEDLKRTGDTNYCIVDGGIHQMNYYGQMMGMKVPYMSLLKAGSSAALTPLPAPGDAKEHWTVCGSLCTTADVIVRDMPADGLEAGDILVFERIGAYSVTEGISLFLSRDLPGVYIFKNGKLTLARKPIFTEEFNYGRTDQDT